MRAGRGFFFAPLASGLAAIWLPLALAFTAPTLEQIPDGYRAGRADAVAGAYQSVVGPVAQPFHDRMVMLQNKAYGLSLMVDDDPVLQSEMVLLLEAQTLRLFLDVAEFEPGRLTAFERSALLYGTTHIYQVVRGNAERLFEDMVRFIDSEIPGPNGAQLRQDLDDSDDSIYLPNYRSDKPLTQAERDTLFKSKLQEFTQKGGNPAEIKTINAEWLKALGAYTRVEYVELENGDIKVTEGLAGHVILAGGQAVLAAGQMIFLKEPSGQVGMVIVSNSSGNFKPDLFSAQKLAQRVQLLTQAPSERVQLTKGEPMSTQAIKIFMKGQFKDKTLIDETVKGMDGLLLTVMAPKPCEVLLLGQGQH